MSNSVGKQLRVLDVVIFISVLLMSLLWRFTFEETIVSDIFLWTQFSVPDHAHNQVSEEYLLHAQFWGYNKWLKFDSIWFYALLVTFVALVASACFLYFRGRTVLFAVGVVALCLSFLGGLNSAIQTVFSSYNYLYPEENFGVKVGGEVLSEAINVNRTGLESTEVEFVFVNSKILLADNNIIVVGTQRHWTQFAKRVDSSYEEYSYLPGSGRYRRQNIFEPVENVKLGKMRRLLMQADLALTQDKTIEAIDSVQLEHYVRRKYPNMNIEIILLPELVEVEYVSGTKLIASVKKNEKLSHADGYVSFLVHEGSYDSFENGSSFGSVVFTVKNSRFPRNIKYPFEVVLARVKNTFFVVKALFRIEPA